MYNIPQHIIGTPRKKAVAYYRSTADEPRALVALREVAQAFARGHGIDIIHEETDLGDSMLPSDNPGFWNILEYWVGNDDAPPFNYVLINDISWWGGLGDQFQASLHNYFCTQKGKEVIRL